MKQSLSAASRALAHFGATVMTVLSLVACGSGVDDAAFTSSHSEGAARTKAFVSPAPPGASGDPAAAQARTQVARRVVQVLWGVYERPLGVGGQIVSRCLFGNNPLITGPLNVEPVHRDVVLVIKYDDGTSEVILLGWGGYQPGFEWGRLAESGYRLVRWGEIRPEDLPDLRTALEDLRRKFPLDRYAAPGSVLLPEPYWNCQDMADAVEDLLRPRSCAGGTVPGDCAR